MDQLKDILAVAKKYHFWILAGIILVAYLGTWWVATSQMTEQTNSRVSKIKGDYSTGQSIQGVTNHPNGGSIEMMKELNKAEGYQVYEAWKRRFSEQEDVLVWPSELKPDFIAAVEPLIPIELTVDYPTLPEKELKLDFRARYRDYIAAEMPKLAEIIGAEWHASQAIGVSSYGNSSGSGMDGYSGSGMGDYGSSSEGDYGSSNEGDYDGGGMGEYGSYSSGSIVPEEEDPIVVAWSQQNQAALQAASFNWVRPTTLQMLYAQENLWILTALMNVIKSTNGDADAQYNAAVKEIMSIDLGPTAAGIKAAGSVSAGMSSSYGSDSGEGYGEEEGEGGSSMYSGAAPVTRDPADYRYVDDSMEPLTGERLRTAMNTASASDAFLVVAKRMPMRVQFKMNVLKLPLLLCEFANAELPVEIRQVRINPRAQSSSGYGGGGAGGGPAGIGSPGAASGGAGGMDMALSEDGGGSDSGSYMSGYGGGEGDYGESGMGGGSMSLADLESPFDATIEIYGLIYIYNPADATKLGLELSTASSTEATDTADSDAAADADASDSSVPDSSTGAPPADSGAPASGTTPADGSAAAAAGTTTSQP